MEFLGILLFFSLMTVCFLISFSFVRKVLYNKKETEVYQTWAVAWGAISFAFFLYMLIDLKVADQLYAGLGIRILHIFTQIQFLQAAIYTRIVSFSILKPNKDYLAYFNVTEVAIKIGMAFLIIFATFFMTTPLQSTGLYLGDSTNVGFYESNIYFSVVDTVLAWLIFLVFPKRKRDDKHDVSLNMKNIRLIALGAFLNALGKTSDLIGVLTYYADDIFFVIDWGLLVLAMIPIAIGSINLRPLHLKERMLLIEDLQKNE